MPASPPAEDIAKQEGRRPGSTGRDAMSMTTTSPRRSPRRWAVVAVAVGTLGALGAPHASAMPADDFPGSAAKSTVVKKTLGAPCFRQPLRWPTAEIGPAPRCTR
jgi:hypothetical protein